MNSSIEFSFSEKTRLKDYSLRGRQINAQNYILSWYVPNYAHTEKLKIKSISSFIHYATVFLGKNRGQNKGVLEYVKASEWCEEIIGLRARHGIESKSEV